MFARQLEHARMTPVHPNWLDIEAIIENAAVEVLYGKQSSEAALSQAQSEVQKVFSNR